VRLDDELLREAKAVAVASGRTLTAVIEDALREVLARRAGGAERAVLPVVRGGSVQAGVDLDDTAALLDLMETAPGSP
jgi:hypothetical protein